MDYEDLSEEQAEAARKVESWLKACRTGAPGRRQLFRLFGGAGTGKSTIAKLLASTGTGLTLNAAPTGKAAAVMTRKGSPADTIHHLIYQPMEAGKNKLEELEKEEKAILAQIERATGPDATIREELRTVRDRIREEKRAMDRPFFALNSESKLRDASLLVLDEISMIDEPTGRDLLSFGVPILALGDPYQLPPVRGAGYFMEGDPDFLLTEVHRQARGSPILHLATEVREGRGLPSEFEERTENGYARVLSGRPDPELVMAANQLLCGRNATRTALNNRCRQLLGYTSAYPEPGDRLVCLKNNRELGLQNGTIWTVNECVTGGTRGRLLMALTSEDGRKIDGCEVLTNAFEGRAVDRWEARDGEQFDFGYALTVHKAQGSQWESVVLFDDWNNSDRRQWLYTGVTRAASSLVVVR